MGNENVVLQDKQVVNITNRVVELFCEDVLARKRMGYKVLSDDSELPNEELIFSIIGDKDLTVKLSCSSEAWALHIGKGHDTRLRSALVNC